jgi:hypothetical protein
VKKSEAFFHKGQGGNVKANGEWEKGPVKKSAA